MKHPVSSDSMLRTELQYERCLCMHAVPKVKHFITRLHGFISQSHPGVRHCFMQFGVSATHAEHSKV